MIIWPAITFIVISILARVLMISTRVGRANKIADTILALWGMIAIACLLLGD